MCGDYAAIHACSSDTSRRGGARAHEPAHLIARALQQASLGARSGVLAFNALLEPRSLLEARSEAFLALPSVRDGSA